MPVYFAVGNHDLSYRVDGIPIKNRNYFENRYYKTYYEFSFHGDLFIVLDPYLDSWSIKGDQLTFLKEVIANKANLSNNIFVFFHPILWRNDDNDYNYILWNSDFGRRGNVNFWNEVVPIFESLTNEVAMFAGDLGYYRTSTVTYDKYKNITLIGSGMAGSDRDNFVIANVDSKEGITYDLICLNKPKINCLGQLTDYRFKSSLKDINFKVFPNPANSSIQILSNNDFPMTVSIYNTSGSLVLEKKLDGYLRESLALDNLNGGVYIIHIENEMETFIQKLIIN